MELRPENAEFESEQRKLLKIGFFLSLTEERPSGSRGYDELKKFADEHGRNCGNPGISGVPRRCAAALYFPCRNKRSLVFRANQPARELSEKSGLRGSRFKREV